MEFTGIITHIWAKETFGESFTKVAVRLEETWDKQYPASVCIDFANKMLVELEKLKTGDIVTVSYNFRTNESKKEPWKFFNSISAWKMKSHELSQDPTENF